MEKNKVSILVIVVILILLLSLNSFALTTQDETLSKLKEFYDAGKEEHVAKYVATQDEEYLKIITGGSDYSAYFSAVFALTDVLSYEIIEPKVIVVDANRVLIYYELKSEAKITETGEIKKIDNEMVAFLYKYPTGWKVRYTVLQELFEDKMAAEVFGKGIIEADVIQDINSTTLKQDFVEKGLLDPKDLSIYKSSNSMSSFNFKTIGFVLVGMILIIAIIFGFKYSRKKKSSHK